jgi:hypothetical protein
MLSGAPRQTTVAVDAAAVDAASGPRARARSTWTCLQARCGRLVNVGDAPSGQGPCEAAVGLRARPLPPIHPRRLPQDRRYCREVTPATPAARPPTTLTFPCYFKGIRHDGAVLLGALPLGPSGFASLVPGLDGVSSCIWCNAMSMITMYTMLTARPADNG